MGRWPFQTTVPVCSCTVRRTTKMSEQAKRTIGYPSDNWASYSLSTLETIVADFGVNLSPKRRLSPKSATIVSSVESGLYST